MSAPQPPEAAVEAGARAMLGEMWDRVFPLELEIARRKSATVLTAALPHLHRDWLEGLIAKAETEVLHLEPYAGYPNTYGAFQRSARTHIINWLRAELAEEGDGE